mmetsp:Transcript_46149/g.97914  ORF Transcript_46149/g.97914 Transcript_46149/m.97914 type:complete len:353 (-) Transcript_46149:1125-2183(-)
MNVFSFSHQLSLIGESSAPHMSFPTDNMECSSFVRTWLPVIVDRLPTPSPPIGETASSRHRHNASGSILGLGVSTSPVRAWRSRSSPSTVAVETASGATALPSPPAVVTATGAGHVRTHPSAAGRSRHALGWGSIPSSITRAHSALPLGSDSVPANADPSTSILLFPPGPPATEIPRDECKRSTFVLTSAIRSLATLGAPAWTWMSLRSSTSERKAECPLSTRTRALHRFTRFRRCSDSYLESAFPSPSAPPLFASSPMFSLFSTVVVRSALGRFTFVFTNCPRLFFSSEKFLARSLIDERNFVSRSLVMTLTSFQTGVGVWVCCGGPPGGCVAIIGPRIIASLFRLATLQW